MNTYPLITFSPILFDSCMFCLCFIILTALKVASARELPRKGKERGGAGGAFVCDGGVGCA